MPKKKLVTLAAPIARIAPVALLGLAGCGATVEGRMLHTPETFSGSSTSGIYGEGTVTVVSDKGVKCDGPYTQVSADDASRAVLTCDDGRRGSVYFLVGEYQAVGTGMLGQDIVTLTMGE